MFGNQFVRSTLVCALALLGACGESHSEDDNRGDITLDLDDGGIGGDASVNDDATTPDVGALPAAGAIGAACNGTADCTGGPDYQCIGDFTDGYCSRDCTQDRECTGDATCVQFSRDQSICLDLCDLSSTERQCRPGYGCSFISTGAVCLPGCTDATDCPGGACDTSSGSGACYTPDAPVGVACDFNEECPLGGLCYDEQSTGWPHGACLVTDCNATDNIGCPANSTCVATTGGDGVCIQSCNETSDCRAGYTCEESPSGSGRKGCQAGCTTNTQCSISGYVCNAALGTCAPPFDADDLGAACNGFTTLCTGGSCLRESTNGYPSGYCAYAGCDFEASDADDGCPGNGVCGRRSETSTPICMKPCSGPSDCRAGYACENVRADDETSPTVCKPRCTDDAQCSQRMRRGFVCHVDTGLCGAPST